MTAIYWSPGQPFSLSVASDDDEAVVALTGELDLVSAHVLEDEVRALRGAGFESVVVDLRQLAFIDSTGLRVLLSLRNSAQRRGQRLTVIPASDERLSRSS
jgi:anti-sigma B factor antagonist